MSTYKQHYRDRTEIQKQKNLKEQRVPIQGRVDIKAIAECTLYFEEKGIQPSTRSELVAYIIEGFATLMKANNKVIEIPSAEMAYRELYKRGLGWEQGTKSHRRVMNVMEQESVDLEDRGNITEDDYKEAFKMYQRDLQKQKDEENAGAIAPKLPTGMIAKTDEDGNIIRNDEDES